MSLTYAEFCAGYGGLGLAVEEVFGAELKWYSEFEAAPSKIMAHHWPGVPNHGDMTTIDFAQVERVDILSGGTPCQDLSHAGRRAGMRSGTRSGLWDSMREAIATIKPIYVVWENVRGAYSAGADSAVEQCPGCMGDAGDRKPLLRALGRVLGDLSDLGFHAEWRGLRAADVGSCHSRFRVFVLATRRDVATDASGSRGNEAIKHDGGSAPAGDWSGFLDESGCDADGLGPLREAIADAYGRDDAGRIADPKWSQEQRETSPWSSERFDWQEYESAIRRWESRLGRSAPRPAEPTGRGGGEQLSARFCEWMMGVDSGWITDVPGVSRNDQLKAAGNGVVKQQAAAALRDMLNHQETP